LEGTSIVRYDEEEEAPGVVTEDERGVATAVGSAVHRMMEHLDLEGDLAVQLRNGLERGLSDIQFGLDGEALTDARERLGILIDRIAEGTCLERLASVAPKVVGREIAIVAPPEDDQGPIGAITGFVDLVYRDPGDGRMVVADYKTDAVEGEESIAERVEIYEPQVNTYARALHQALDLDSEPRVELWFLAADKIVRL
jgi:ATP-dependent exoDNAse (exonuclease V) beta subunit